MKVLVVGAGGREHALCWSLAASSLINTLYCAPGSDAIGEDAQCVAIAADDLDGLVGFCQRESIDLVVPGPELPLVLGLRDRLDQVGIKCFGPSAAAAKLEGSKSFMKDFAKRHGIPTARYAVFGRGEGEAARDYVRKHGAPLVIKADGLAAGKGVTVAMSEEDAFCALDEAESGAFGDAGQQVVIEEFLEGEEASFFALVDGVQVLGFGTAQDHKAVGDGDIGPNTGGMGAYSPAPCMTDEMVERAISEIIMPTVKGMVDEGADLSRYSLCGLDAHQ